MAAREVLYRSPEERRNAVRQARLHGESMLHDDYLEVAEDGAVRLGRLTFGVKPLPVEPDDVVLRRVLRGLKGQIGRATPAQRAIHALIDLVAPPEP